VRITRVSFRQRFDEMRDLACVKRSAVALAADDFLDQHGVYRP
jgi:hypothetical protein